MTDIRTNGIKRILTLGLAALGAILLFLPKGTHAMTISPPVLDFTLNPGDVVSDVIQVSNEESVPFKIQPVAVNFYAKEGDEISGAPAFYPADEVKNGYELAPWIKFNDGDAMVIGANERVNIPFNISVPMDAAPGSRFGAVQIMAGRPDDILAPDAPNIEIQRGTTVLIFVRVAGDVRDELVVSDFETKPAYSHLPVDFTVRLTNGGTTHQRPTGNVIIEDMLGRQVASLVVNPGPQFRSVLPGSARRFDVSWTNRKLAADAGEYAKQMRNFAFGKYTATLLVNYGSAEQQKSMTAVTTFIVLPWMALLTYAGVGLVAVLVIVFVARGYNRMVIRRYEASKNSTKS